MEELIEEYLFQHKQCPLPKLGSLVIEDGKAFIFHSEKKISGPVPQILFQESEIPAAHFIAFIALRNNQSNASAAIELDKYCRELIELKEYQERKLDQAGRFYIDIAGKLVFEQKGSVKDFVPLIPIKRVIHSKVASHNIMVGDKEATREEMVGYFNDKEKVTRATWWIWAMVLMLIGVAVISFYFKDHSIADNFGNVQKNIPVPAEKTYRAN